MNPSHDLLLAELARVLNRLKVPYMVIGGQAVLRHGEPRITRDIDITMAVSPVEAMLLMKRLAKHGLKPIVERPEDFVLRTHVLPCQTDKSLLRVDFGFTDSPYEQQAIAHGVDVVPDGVPVSFASAEDLVIHKIIAARPIDHQDVMGILLKNPDLDADYVRDWLRKFAEVRERPLSGGFRTPLAGVAEVATHLQVLRALMFALALADTASILALS